ncbi:MAG: histidinol-phosphate aminotransferase [Pseudomonadota bacterium]|jgi:histidinol-phosphate aminotransferase
MPNSFGPTLLQRVCVETEEDEMPREQKTLQELFRAEALSFPKYALNEPPARTRLHQNEMLLLTQSEREELISVLARSAENSSAINTYPSLQPERLLAAFAHSLNVSTDNIEVTAGSSQALTLLAEALFAAGRRVAITAPSFSLYAHLARLYGSDVTPIDLDENFEFSPRNLFSAQVLESDVAIICSPNNPTGTTLSYETILEFADQFKGVLVVDEAYFEFFAPQGGVSCVGLATQRNNVIVLRTMSKAWAGAGLRVGAMVAHRDVISIFSALKPPYSIAWPSEVMAAYLLSEKAEETAVRVQTTISQLDELQAALKGLRAVECLADSKANFVFFKTSQAARLEDSLVRKGFLIRRYSGGRLNDCVRISMPPSEYFESLKTSLLEVLS